MGNYGKAYFERVEPSGIPQDMEGIAASHGYWRQFAIDVDESLGKEC